MNLANHYWYFKSALTPRFCDEVIRYANAQKETMAITGGYGREKGDKPLNKEEIKDLKRKRNSDLVWLNDTWIYKELHPYVHTANKNAGWNFEWDRSESCQFTKYKLNQYYDWHSDSWNKHYLKGFPKFQTTRLYLVPAVTGFTLCHTKLGNTMIDPFGNISLHCILCFDSSRICGS